MLMTPAMHAIIRPFPTSPSASVASCEIEYCPGCGIETEEGDPCVECGQRGQGFGAIPIFGHCPGCTAETEDGDICPDCLEEAALDSDPTAAYFRLLPLTSVGGKTRKDTDPMKTALALTAPPAPPAPPAAPLAVLPLHGATDPAAPFALILTGNALSPRYRHGDVIAIDPARPAAPGDAVLVAFDGNRKSVGVMLLNADGDLVDNHRGHVRAGHFEVIGTVTASCPTSTASINTRTGTVRLPIAHKALRREGRRK